MLRRELLRHGGVWAASLAAAAGAGGCRAFPAVGLRARTPLPVRLDPPVPSLAIASSHYYAYTAALLAPVLAAYNASQTAAEASFAVPGAALPAPVAVAPSGVLDGQPHLSAGAGVPSPLSAPLRQANWNPAALAPGFVDALRWHGQLMAVPYDFVASGVAVSVADWRRLGVPLPSPAWTSADFAASCAKLRVAAGRQASVLAGAIGMHFPAPSVWTGWVWGYGGRLVDASGRLVLTDRGARTGISALAGAVRAARPNMCATTGEMAFVHAGRHALPPAAADGSTGLWPFPAMPAAPVIPAQVLGLGVNPQYPRPEAAVDFLAWLTGPAGQAAMVSVGYPSVLARPPAGSNAWRGGYPPGFDHGGLETPVGQVRPIPWQIFLLSNLLGITMWRAVDAVTAPQLEALLAKAEQQANAALELQGSAQLNYLLPFRKWYTANVPPLTAADLQCYLPALPGYAPSHYATAVPAPSSG